MRRLLLNCQVPLQKITYSPEVSSITRTSGIARLWNWLKESMTRRSDACAYRSLMKRLGHIDARGPYSREEMNQR